MHRRHAITAFQFILMVLALLTAIALVFGVRPRTLAEEVGAAPIKAGVCFLCDGSATAAAIAPAAEAAVPATLLITVVFAVPWLRRFDVATGILGLGASPPLLPPPRG